MSIPMFKEKNFYGRNADRPVDIQTVISCEISNSYDGYSGGALEHMERRLAKLQDIVETMASTMSPEQQITLADRLGYNEV